ncbi:Heavy metal transport/detoxification superfamily protein [Trifolium repens]|nr:Heavy metal transport/detoxification superfamily protein [Trifolium repens]
MSNQNHGRVQRCILKVNIDCKCQGCENNVKKVLLKIQGVVEVKIDLEGGKVRVVGDVDPNELIKNLKKYSGKNAEICSIQKGSNHIAKKNDNDEEKKSSKGKVFFLGPLLFGFLKKSKNGGVVAETSKNNSKSNSKNDHNTTCHGVEGSNNGNRVNNNGYMQEHSIMNNGDSEDANANATYDQQYMAMMNNGDSEYHHHHHHHHHQGMQMQMQPSSYDQQQYMAMMNQQEGDMSMYPSTMMHGGGPYSSMNNYMLPQQMLSHPNYMANPTHNENAEGYWIM